MTQEGPKNPMPVVVTNIEMELGITAKKGDEFLKACLKMGGSPVGDPDHAITELGSAIKRHLLLELQDQARLSETAFSNAAVKPERKCKACKKPLPKDTPGHHELCGMCFAQKNPQGPY